MYASKTSRARYGPIVSIDKLLTMKHGAYIKRPRKDEKKSNTHKTYIMKKLTKMRMDLVQTINKNIDMKVKMKHCRLTM